MLGVEEGPQRRDAHRPLEVGGGLVQYVLAPQQRGVVDEYVDPARAIFLVTLAVLISATHFLARPHMLNAAGLDVEMTYTTIQLQPDAVVLEPRL